MHVRKLTAQKVGVTIGGTAVVYYCCVPCASVGVHYTDYLTARIEVHTHASRGREVSPPDGLICVLISTQLVALIPHIKGFEDCRTTTPPVRPPQDLDIKAGAVR